MSLFRKKKSMPNGLWIRCNGCAGVIYKKTLDLAYNVCPECDYHFRIGSKDRLRMMLDIDSFEEYWSSMHSADPLNFTDRIPYKERILNEQNKTGMKAACVAGKGKIYGKEVMFAVTDPGFVMGSMGSVVGEKITRSAEKAFELHVPLIIVTGSGGGARMQEGVISLMQMAKTSAAIAKLQKGGGLYIVVITDPTLGGVMASFASQADIIIAEPGALIGFAGPRVIEQTIKKSLPPGFQTSEFMLDHGFIDMIVERDDLKDKVSKLLNFLCEKETEEEGKILSENNNTMTYQTAAYSNELVAS
ncbi:MAG: acetyl-CoA carboxylase, carboxyltransferase subunit beta [Candidatus Anammoxibacter sp.]